METVINKAPLIKICGITRVEEAFYLNEARAAYAGFVFWEKSRRNVTFAQAEEIGRFLSKDVKRVAVTVSPSVKHLREAEQAGFDLLKVHGTLQEEILACSKLPIWQACNLETPRDIEKLAAHKKIAGYVIDAGTAGSGRTFDWNSGKYTVQQAKATVFKGKTFVLAGGLNTENIEEAVRIFQPDVADVSSGVEGVCGKDREKILEFAEKIRRKGEKNGTEGF